MKKLLTYSIIAVSMALFSTTSLADRLDTSDLFVKVHASGNIFGKAKQLDDIKAKSQISPSIAFGLGYYILDNFRADLTYEHYINSTFKHSIKDDPLYGSQQFTQDVTLATLMLNGNVDILKLEATTIFLRAGVGIARHKTKYHITGTDVGGNNFDIGCATKQSNNLAYNVGTGVAFPISNSVNAEIAYSWTDFGNTKPKKNSVGDNITRKTRYRSHNVSVGLRIDT